MKHEALLKKYSPRRENLLMILHELQNADPQHYLSNETLQNVADYLNITSGEVMGIVGYYSMLSNSPRGKYVIRLCTSPVCRMLGSIDLLEELKAILEIDVDETSSDELFTIEKTECLGNCHNGPSMMINEVLYSNLETEKMHQIIDGLRAKAAGEALDA